MQAVSCPFPFLLGCPWGPEQGFEPLGGVASAAHLPGWGCPHPGGRSCCDGLTAALPICESLELGEGNVHARQTPLHDDYDWFGLVSLRFWTLLPAGSGVM